MTAIGIQLLRFINKLVYFFSNEELKIENGELIGH